MFFSVQLIVFKVLKNFTKKFREEKSILNDCPKIHRKALLCDVQGDCHLGTNIILLTYFASL